MADEVERDERSFGQHRLLQAVLLIALGVRTAAVLFRFENLHVDTDAYLAIAQNLLAGNGFCSVPENPTAFRPPLYPFFLALCLGIAGPVAAGTAQAALGVVTVWLTFRLARLCGLCDRACLLAAFLVAVDPLLVEYTTRVMTETLFTFLATLLLVTSLWHGPGVRKGVAVGAVFGLTALCRPSIWAFGGLGALIWLLSLIRSTSSVGERVQSSEGRRERLTVGLACVFAVAGVVSPWVVRNALVFERPILMTTHGGYTLLLGNNATFYGEVVAGPSGAVWDGASLSAWQLRQEEKLQGMGIEVDDEVARDAAFSKLARGWIVDHPVQFLQCSVLRVQRFWASRPSVSADVPPVVLFAVRIWYLAMLMLSAFSLVRWRSRWMKNWTLPAFVLALTAVHAVYWSNARMRSAAIPVVSIAAAAAFQRFERQEQ